MRALPAAFYLEDEMAKQNDGWFEIFRAGRHTATNGTTRTWSKEDLDEIASSYYPQTHEAPITLDHAKSGPAFGWIAALKRDGDRLLARAKDVTDGLKGLVQSALYKKRSAEIYPNFQGTGRLYLRAVSFLGAAVPSVKGLRDVGFSEEAGEAEHYEFADEPPSRADDRRGKEEENMDYKEQYEKSQQELGEARKENEAKNATIKAKDDALKHAEKEKDDLHTKTRKQEIESFCEKLTKEGHFVPAWKAAGIAEFMMNIDASEELEFSEEKKMSRLDWFKDFLTGLPKVVKFEEVATRDTDPGKSDKVDEFVEEGDKIAATVNE